MKTKKIIVIVLAVLIALIVLLVAATEIYFAVCRVDCPDVEPNSTVKYIAHRGLSSKYYQNTEEAFLAAAQSDFFSNIETDVRLTADGRWVCTHDNDPFEDKTKLVSELKLSEMAQLPLDADKAGYDEVVTEGARICTIEKYLNICKQYGKTPEIEVKIDANDAQITALLVTVTAILPLDKVGFICFNRGVVDEILSQKPEATAKWLMSNSRDLYVGLRCKYNVACAWERLTEAKVKRSHSNKRYVSSWTVNDAEDAQKLIDMGVDYITTDKILF